MTKQEAEKNIKLYYYYEVFLEPLFWGPILILFIQRVAGMSLSHIFIMEAVVVSGLIFLEVPSGALADLIGRKKTIFVGVCLFALDRVLFTTAINPLMIWLGNLTWMVGYSLVSGADSSLLYDTLKFLGRETEYKKINGRASSYRLAVIAVSCLFAGHMAEIHLRLPMVLSTITLVVNCFIARRFVEPPLESCQEHNWRGHWNLMKMSVLFVANHQKVKWIIAYVVLLGVVSKVWFFTYNPYFELVELPIWSFGYIFFALGLIAAISSYHADWLSKKLGDLGSIVMMILLLGAPILLMSQIVVKAAAMLVLLQNVVRGYLRPFTTHFLHAHLDSKNRATVLSIQSAMNSLGQTIMLGIFGWLLKLYSLPFCLGLLGIFTLIGGGLLIIGYRRIFGFKS